MIIVRENKNPKTRIIKAFSVYLRLDDGTEHEIPGVISVKQDNFKDQIRNYHLVTADIVIDERHMKTE